jgi:hypothetical protein
VDTAAELRATSDGLLLDLEALANLEDQKRGTQHGDPKLVDLAEKIEELALRVLVGSRRQRELTETISESAEVGDADAEESIAAMRSASVILAEWREAERAARGADPDSAERAAAEAMVDRLREEYRAAFEAARRDLR